MVLSFTFREKNGTMWAVDFPSFLTCSMSNKVGFINKLFTSTSKNSKSKRSRACRFEELENREMLSVTPWSLVDGVRGDTVTGSLVLCEEIQSVGNVQTDAELIAAINSKYGLTIADNANVIKITDAANFRTAIGTAGTGSLIVVENNVQKIQLTSGQLEINKNLTIVSLEGDLTITADTDSRVFSIAAGSDVAMAGMTITGGFGNFGGGFYISSGAELTLTNSLVTQNTALFGGAMYNDGKVAMTNCTIAGNTATSYGGIAIGNSSTLVINNTIVAENTGSPDIGIQYGMGTGTIAGTNNLIGDPGTLPSSFLAGGNLVGEDPMFVDPDNGNYHLHPASPAIVAGIGAYGEQPATLSDREWLDNFLAEHDDLELGEEEFVTWTDGRITELDLQCKGLTDTLDVSALTALQRFICHSNQLTTLDVSKNTALTYLDCSNNKLTALDVSNNVALTILGCKINQLTELDVSKNTALIELYCSFNQLTELDVSKNTELIILWCQNNQLAVLDVSQNTALQTLDCSSNQLRFSTLKLPTQAMVNRIDAQRNIPITLGTDNTVDLSSEYLGGTTSYAWYCNGSPLTNGINYTVTNGKFTFNDINGSIVCRMTNNGFPGLMLSTTGVTIGVTPEANIPTFSEHPQSTSYTQGEIPTALSVTASGNGMLWYQWYKDDEEIIGAMLATYFPSTAMVGTATYYCVVTNIQVETSETAKSETATITVNVPLTEADTPTISVPPQSATYTQGQTATVLSIVATGNGTLTYQWYMTSNDSTVFSESPTYTPSTATVGTSGYYCVVTNTLDGTSKTAQSNAATITVVESTALPDVPTISAHPQTATYTQGQTVTALSVTATGNGTLLYQWYKDGVAMDGETSDSYTPSTATVDITEYYCIVTNTLNKTSETATSNTATITVNAETQMDYFTVESEIKNSLTISWTDSLPEGAVFQYSADSGTTWITWKGNTDGNSTTIPGLKDGEYEVRLMNAEGNVLHEEPVAVDAPSGGTVAPVAKKPKVKAGKKGTTDATTIRAITLTLTKHKKATAESNALYVITHFVKVDKVWMEIERVSTSDDKCTFTGLNPNTSYKFTITATNADGDSVNGKGKPVAANVTAKTAKYVAVKKLKTVRDQSSVTLNWMPSKALLPAGAATKYEVVIMLNNTVQKTLPDFSDTSVTISDLLPSTKYKFTVRAISTVDGIEIASLIANVSVKTLKIA